MLKLKLFKIPLFLESTRAFLFSVWILKFFELCFLNKRNQFLFNPPRANLTHLWFLAFLLLRWGNTYTYIHISGTARISVRAGGKVYGVGLVEGPGGAEPPDAIKFWKFPKNFSRNLQKMDYFRRFLKENLKTLR